MAKVSCILRHWGVQLIFAYSWARPAILVADKGLGEIFYCPPPFRRKARGHSIRVSVVRNLWCVVPSL